MKNPFRGRVRLQIAEATFELSWEKLKLSQRNDATAAPRWCFGLATIVPLDAS
jgi:hypothetical protein